MNSKNNDGFYLTIGMFFVVSICILFAICGEDLIKEVCMFDKVMIRILIGFALAVFLTLFVWGCKIYFSDFNVINEWTLASVMKDNKKYTAIIFDEAVSPEKNYIDLEKAVFYSKTTKIGSKVFAGCQNLKEVIFYEDPMIIESDAFIGCTNLARITFYGTKKNFDEYKIFIPSNPRIEFIPIPESEKKQEQNIINVNCSGTVNIKSH